MYLLQNRKIFFSAYSRCFEILEDNKLRDLFIHRDNNWTKYSFLLINHMITFDADIGKTFLFENFCEFSIVNRCKPWHEN